MTNPPSLQGVALIAGDDGAKAALQPLAASGASFAMESASARALVSGTSQSDAGFAREAAARVEAAKRGIPTACIEDFPGNYREVDGASTTLLVVESAFSETLYRERFGSKAPPMAVIPPARYDALRGEARQSREDGPCAVLWAGQPETDACLATLRFLRDFLLKPEVELLFRAHPRDAGHGKGAYRELLSGLRSLDVSSEPLAATLRRPLRLVLTQFSSVAVEAGFLGIPSVHVLLPDAGGALLRMQKGYAVPAPCAAGASFLADDARDTATLERALGDAGARREALRRFRALYAADVPQAPRLVEAIAGIIA